ncbi:MAG TPA: hypothetical protein VF520_08920 [Thermoleophilaceae bacterium]|jgi:hypothetical protein
MAQDRRFELDELIVRPGTYFNPQTEVLVVVDDSASMDGEIFNLEDFEGADWVLISDDAPVDEAKRDELLESFQARSSGGDGREVDLGDEDEMERLDQVDESEEERDDMLEEELE